MAKREIIARVDASGIPQPLSEHLENVSRLCEKFLAPFGFPQTGRLLGVSHDIGKAAPLFQRYIYSCCGLLDANDPDFLPDAMKLRGQIPHAGAGARYLERFGDQAAALLGLLQMPVACHHQFLDDIISPDGGEKFAMSLSKPYSFKQSEIDLNEIFGLIPPEAKNVLEHLQQAGVVAREMNDFIHRKAFKQLRCPEKAFVCGLMLRLFYSALIDADRLDAAGQPVRPAPDWLELSARLEKYLAAFKADSELNILRAKISQCCLAAAPRPGGIYRLTVPTGGGKTLAVLRFALNHAGHRKLDRVIYAAPFISILEQNAAEARKALNDSQGIDVLECHSNLLPDNNGDNEKATPYAENWDTPVVFTTLVQLLNAMFSGESRYARRFHQLGHAVIIFDEIQSLPMNMIHIFNRAVNFLAEELDATIVLCSATQPRLGDVNAEFGALRFSASAELYPNPQELFTKLKRVQTVYKPEIKTDDKIVEFASSELNDSLLLIVNTRAHAARLFKRLHDAQPNAAIFHLSTNMCPAHRRTTLENLRKALDNRRSDHTRPPVVAVSTSLIEAGVDISFECVIRMMTQLDSVVQAAGRCNRHAEKEYGNVFIFDDPPDVRTPSYIKTGADITKNVLEKFRRNPAIFNNDLLSPALLRVFYAEMTNGELAGDVMKYPVEHGRFNLLSLLGDNISSLQALATLKHSPQKMRALGGAYRTAAQHFRALDDISAAGAIVPYGDGARIIAEMCGKTTPEEFNRLLRQAQLYSVNLSDSMLRKLRDIGAVHQIAADTEVLCIDAEFYRPETGIDVEPATMSTLDY